MSRRFPLPSGGSVVLTSLGYATGWNKTSQAARFPLPRTLTDTVDVSRTALTSATSPELHCVAQFQSPALAAQTISGTLKGQIRSSVNNLTFAGTVAIAARVVSSDGLTLRGELLAPTASQSASTPPRLSTSTINRSFRDSADNTDISLNPVTSISGDILVVEIGARDVDTGTTRSAALRFLDLAINAYLPEDETTSTALNPWVEFSHSIVFADEVAAPLISEWGNTSWDILHVLKRKFRQISTRVSKRDS